MNRVEPLSEPAARPAVRAFPSLLIHRDRFEARGAFAQAQAMYLSPDPDVVERLTALLSERAVGVVAHYYMDAELQGVLSACSHPDIDIADSLRMADRAVAMAARGARAIVVLGVDFMSENVRATLDQAGFAHVPVYRVASDPIGCSLAESAEAPAYRAYLQKAAQTPRSLHVIYVNTSLRVKAAAQSLVPTITCTSSNVVPLVLQAFVQFPGAHIWFGPDTYMGHNLAQMLEAFAGASPELLSSLHPELTPALLKDAVKRFHYFEQGVCVVHHMFGARVAEQVRRDYPDAFVTAHLEVPGEMFTLGFEAQREGRGVVGSTSNILEFITARVRERADAQPSRDEQAHPRFILGTESGMVTAIARAVQRVLREHTSGTQVSAEIVFPVASEAISTTQDPLLRVVPGVQGGEGCTVAGGCATCPFMKMNSLDALFDLLEQLRPGAGEQPELAAYLPKSYSETIDGKSVAELGAQSIAAMRTFQKTGRLPELI